MTQIRRRSVASFVVALAAFAALAGASTFAPGPVGAEPSGGCRTVGGDRVGTAGTHRATVVVDTGSGDVWSACITFDGTVTGIEALELAAATISGLSPVYEPYAGEGRAVCRLLGVGNDPPNCLSKSVEYWAYFRNGVYSRGGGSSAVVGDGDVEGWSFGRGTAPRPATVGTEAVPLSAMPTTTTAPPPTSIGPVDPAVPTDPAGSPSEPAPDGPSGAGSDVDGAAAGTTPPAAGSGGGAGGGSDAPGAGQAPVGGDGSPVGEGDEAGGAGEAAPVPPDQGGLVGTESAGTAGTMTLGRAEDDDDGSPVASMLGFGGALGVAGLAVVLVRRRRHAADARPGPAPSTSAST